MILVHYVNQFFAKWMGKRFDMCVSGRNDIPGGGILGVADCGDIVGWVCRLALST